MQEPNKQEFKAGDLVNVYHCGIEHKGVRLKYSSACTVVYECKGVEKHAGRAAVVITPHTPEPSPQELMLDDLNSLLNNSRYIRRHSSVIGVILDALVRTGWHK